MTSTVLKVENTDAKLTLLRVDQLKPHEKGSPLYLELLRKEILRDGVLKYPIIADEKTNVILDGMHRWLALMSLGYELIPVILVDVFKNQRIHVGKRRIHRYTNGVDKEISIEEVILAGVSGHLMEPRSTRHFFPFSKFQEINYPLHSLKKNAAQDVLKYLSKMTDNECSLAMEQWLEEICEELEFLSKRMEEVEREKEEFLNRVKGSANGF
ncbi:MAG: ParB N-terminal domain-containing protein [Candidatus Bathyarchaeia archaeon]